MCPLRQRVGSTPAPLGCGSTLAKKEQADRPPWRVRQNAPHQASLSRIAPCMLPPHGSELCGRQRQKQYRGNCHPVRPCGWLHLHSMSYSVSEIIGPSGTAQDSGAGSFSQHDTISEFLHGFANAVVNHQMPFDCTGKNYYHLATGRTGTIHLCG